jgi:hypothetical protein
MSGTNPTLDVKIQQSPNGSTGWEDLAFFERVTSVPAWKNVTVLTRQPYLRCVFTVGGTGTPVFSGVSVGPDIGGANCGY